MELGNIIFGNSRGEHEVNRGLQDEWCSYMEDLGFDSYGYHEKSDDSGLFENETFRVQPYYWGECECDFDARDHQWSREHKHFLECYQSELRREKIAAGARPQGEFGWLERPATLSYDEWNAVESAIYDRLCQKHGRDRRFGCAVHCTCSHDADYAAWRNLNDHAETCRVVTPNFTHKPSGFTLQWYKYPLRDSYSSAPLTRKLMRSMWADCAASVDTHPQGGDAQQAPASLSSAVAKPDAQPNP